MKIVINETQTKWTGHVISIKCIPDTMVSVLWKTGSGQSCRRLPKKEIQKEEWSEMGSPVNLSLLLLLNNLNGTTCVMAANNFQVDWCMQHLTAYCYNGYICSCPNKCCSMHPASKLHMQLRMWIHPWKSHWHQSTLSFSDDHKIE